MTRVGGVIYSRWDGRQAVESIDAEALFAAMADDLLEDGNLERTLTRLLRQGDPNLPGLPTLQVVIDTARQRRDQATEADRPALDELLTALQATSSTEHLAALDQERIELLLGSAARQALIGLQSLGHLLVRAGLVVANDNGLELTPQAIRLLGQHALATIFRHLGGDSSGQHTSRRGQAGEPTEISRPYQAGEPLWIDLVMTLRQALQRQGRGLPLHLQAGDFWIAEPEAQSRAATVIALDVSRSMLLQGCFVAGKRVALALHSLIESRYRHDRLALVTFAQGARLVDAWGLPRLTIDDMEYGTNLQAGLLTARHWLGRQGTANKQVVVITDGEPTAHWEAGETFFSYPPSPRTTEMTLREVAACTRAGITINTFLLDRTHYRPGFIDSLTRLNRGRTFIVTPDRLGPSLLIDYVDRQVRR